MDNIFTTPIPKTDTEYQSAIDQMLAEIHRIREAMRRDDLEIAASRTRTDATWKNIETIMANRWR